MTFLCMSLILFIAFTVIVKLMFVKTRYTFIFFCYLYNPKIFMGCRMFNK